MSKKVLYLETNLNEISMISCSKPSEFNAPPSLFVTHFKLTPNRSEGRGLEEFQPPTDAPELGNIDIKHYVNLEVLPEELRNQIRSYLKNI